MDSSLGAGEEHMPRRRVITEARREQNRIAQLAWSEWEPLPRYTPVKLTRLFRTTPKGDTVTEEISLPGSCHTKKHTTVEAQGGSKV